MAYRYFFKQLYKVSKLIIVILPMAGLLYLIYLDFVPSGHLEFVYDFSKDSPAITNLFPANRLTDINKISETESFWQAIQVDPVYFDVRLPQKFTTARVELVYQNKNQPLVQIGLRTIGETEWNYQFKPLENQLIDNLNWPAISNGEISLWQRNKRFQTIDQFYDKFNELEKVGAYYYDIERKFMMPDYQPVQTRQIINKTVRGAYSLYTYIKNEPLDFTFKIQDINRSDGPDPFVFKVYNDKNVKIIEKEIADDGQVSKWDPASLPREINIKIENLPEGVYRLQLDAEDEIFTRSISTYQQYLTFIDHLYLVDNIEYADGFTDLIFKPTILYSTVPRLGFMTAHPEGRQSVKINDQTLDILDTHKNYFITALVTPNLIYLPENDIKVFGRGLLAFSQTQFFNPEIYHLRDFSGNLGIDYLISEYQTPQEVNGWKINSVKFNLTDALVSQRKLRFVLSAPELNDSGGIIPLKQIKIFLDKPPLSVEEFFNKIFGYIKNNYL